MSISKKIIIAASAFMVHLEASPTTWDGTSSNNLNLSTNWNPPPAPVLGQTAIFDSSVSGINLNPVATANFSTGTLMFNQLTPGFNITIPSFTLTLNELGLTGSTTNTTITCTNQDNRTFPLLSNQIVFSGSTATSGEAVLQISNNGVASGSDTSISSSQLLGSQFFSSQQFTMGSNTQILVSNSGVDSSNSTGENIVGIIRSGQSQIYALQGFSAGSNAVISVGNSGTFNGSSVLFASSNIGTVGGSQMLVTGPFIAQDALQLSATNSGSMTGATYGSNFVGNSNGQFTFDSTFTVGNDATIVATNSGLSECISSNGDNDIGNILGSQFSSGGAFQAGTGLNFTVMNGGTHQGPAVAFAGIVAVSNPHQVYLQSTATVGDSATFTISNSGVILNHMIDVDIGEVDNGDQIFLQGAFQAGNSLVFNVSNEGMNQGGTGFAMAGSVGSNQLECGASFTVLDHAAVSVTNEGVQSGTYDANANITGVVSQSQVSGSTIQAGDFLGFTVSNTGNDGSSGPGLKQVGAVNRFQVDIGTFQAGNSLNFSADNIGQNNGTGNGNNIGYISDSQLQFSQFTTGDNAVITVSNSGIDSSSSSGNFTGYVGGDQFVTNVSFQAEENLSLTAINSANNTGGSTNVGYVAGSQLAHSAGFSAGNGAFIFASNTGRVGGSQIWFQQGFDITGKGTIQAVNHGTVTGHGIRVDQGSGGDVDIILENASLYIPSPNATFTIGALNGDSTSTVQSSPMLIIKTDSGVNALFAGAIQDFAHGSTLEKDGPGTQTLSGTNTFTGLTTINEGDLILTGTGVLTGSVLINPQGTLSGTGTVLGNVLNEGTISPGYSSIGTIHFGSYNNNGGTYDVDINGLGQSDLIEVTGPAVLDGGLVVVSTIDGVYNLYTSYTIVSAGSRTGTFSGAVPPASFPLLFKPVLTYDLQHVYLTILPNIAIAGKTANERSVARQLDGIRNPTPLQEALLNQIFSLPLDQVQAALDSLSGWQHTSNLWVVENVNNQFVKRLYDAQRFVVQKCCRYPCETWTVWGEGGYTDTNLRGNPNAHGFSLNGGQFTLGAERTYHSNVTLGVAGSYEYDHLGYKHGGGSSNNNNYFAGLYGIYRPSCFYALADATYGYSTNNMNRAIRVGSSHYNARSNPTFSQATFYGEFGVDWKLSMLLIQPFIGASGGSNWGTRIVEKPAGGWEMEVNRTNRAVAATRLGFHIAPCSDMEGLSFFLDVAYDRSLTTNNNTTREQFINFGQSFGVIGVNLDYNSFDYALTVAKRVHRNLNIYFEAAGQVWNNGQTVSALAGLDYKW